MNWLPLPAVVPTARLDTLVPIGLAAVPEVLGGRVFQRNAGRERRDVRVGIGIRDPAGQQS